MASILAVDDDLLLLKLIRKILERDGHHVTAVSDPLVVKDLSLSGYSLVLLDVMMPGIDGFELCRLSHSIFNSQKRGGGHPSGAGCGR